MPTEPYSQIIDDIFATPALIDQTQAFLDDKTHTLTPTDVAAFQSAIDERRSKIDLVESFLKKIST